MKFSQKVMTSLSVHLLSHEKSFPVCVFCLAGANRPDQSALEPGIVRLPEFL
jgi:hypothetical protein